nr:hypothetical protein [uncultured Dysosmobacter sp.]
MNKEERRQDLRTRLREQEKRCQAAALRQIRDNLQATPGERLEAVKLLMELGNEQ